jgi:hypothetical protein
MDSSFLVKTPTGIVRHLPGVPFGVDEHTGVSAPDRRRACASDEGPGSRSLVQRLADEFRRRDV